jgi:hypothetical protein
MEQTMEQQQNQNQEVKEFKPKPWLKKPAEQKKVQGYYYVKAKFKKIAHEEIEKLTQQWK